MPTLKVLRIFVVDDREVIASTLATILNRSGHTATFFTNPLKALAAAGDDPPDYLISDVMMPELSGIDLAVLMLQHYPSCKVLLFSGQADSEDLLFNARKQGWTFELLCKPVHPTEIIRRVQEHSRSKPGTRVEEGSTVDPSVRKRHALNSQPLHAAA